MTVWVTERTVESVLPAMTDRPWFEDAPLSELLREARWAYREAIQGALAEGGFDDIPRNGSLVLAGFDPSKEDPPFGPQADVVSSLGLSKQAASQLIDTLVLRGYLERRNDPEDRRRMGVRLTERGRAAARAIRERISALERDVARLVTAEDLRGLRASLAAYQVIRERAGTER